MGTAPPLTPSWHAERTPGAPAIIMGATGTAGPELKAALLAYCRERLATYKCPRTVDFTDQLPREPNGKLYKRLLRERYWAGHGSLVI